MKVYLLHRAAEFQEDSGTIGIYATKNMAYDEKYLYEDSNPNDDYLVEEWDVAT